MKYLYQVSTLVLKLCYFELPIELTYALTTVTVRWRRPI